MYQSHEMYIQSLALLVELLNVCKFYIELSCWKFQCSLFQAFFNYHIAKKHLPMLNPIESSVSSN